MQPVKFSGDPSEFPAFRERVRDNLEDGVLSDSQRVEFHPKFLTGLAYEVVKRLTGCSYEAVISTLEEKYGKPATVAAACINNLTKGPRLGNNDYVGLFNFGEQLEAAAKTLKGQYRSEASTLNTLRQIVGRLPGYLINKWGGHLVLNSGARGDTRSV
ncbi:predicted protein [Nematostella vectensis]|uniref:Uncharacterized protein n=1 Tax=Nematostella vectensis TaxID=45351 RepID=A7SB35_NEMVE|nr:predicted protein [Nematostella vectensis]|eukprot:XP_001631155.1 predicted protein [Nematostella vectensis]